MCLFLRARSRDRPPQTGLDYRVCPSLDVIYLIQRTKQTKKSGIRSFKTVDFILPNQSIIVSTSAVNLNHIYIQIINWTKWLKEPVGMIIIKYSEWAKMSDYLFVFETTEPSCWPPEALPRLLGPIVVSWLLPVCFSGSLISQEEKRTSTSDRSSAGSQDRIKRSPLLDRELLAHLREAAPLRQDDYFWQCLSQEGTFADLMGPGPLYAAFCMAPCHHFHSVEGEKKMSRGCCLKWISNKSVVFKVIPNAADIFPTVTSL